MGTTDDFATIPCNLVLFSAALVELAMALPLHSLIVSSHLFCLPSLFLFTVHYRIIFAKPEYPQTWHNALTFRFKYTNDLLTENSVCFLDYCKTMSTINSSFPALPDSYTIPVIVLRSISANFKFSHATILRILFFIKSLGPKKPDRIKHKKVKNISILVTAIGPT